MAVTQRNRTRLRAILISQQVKWLFQALPGRWQARGKGWLARQMFLAPDGQVHRAGEILLADLRDFALVGHPIFSTEPLVMARRLGRREVVERLMNYLNLDESTVQKLMELDDGLD